MENTQENKPSKVILHCSATPDYPEPSEKYDLFGAADIDVWHRRRGWKGIGYHIVIRRTGIIENGRAIKTYGAHAKGHNRNSIGICWIGERWPTNKQLDAIGHLYLNIQRKYGIQYNSWIGHHELNKKKDCPGFPMEILRRFLQNLQEPVSA